MSKVQVSESRVIDATCERIFALLADPTMHASIDGTGMLRDAIEGNTIRAVGDEFYVAMVHWDRGNYIKTNVVLEFELNRRLVWAPIKDTPEKPTEKSNFNGTPDYFWGWVLRPLEDGTTEVTEFFDCTNASEHLRSYIKDGEFWRLSMINSLMNLERLATTN